MAKYRQGITGLTPGPRSNPNRRPSVGQSPAIRASEAGAGRQRSEPEVGASEGGARGPGPEVGTRRWEPEGGA
jgi:hypothetical protein